MPNFHSNYPMCNRPDDEIAGEDKITRYERNNTGVLTGLIEPEGERYVCSCECQLFFLDRIGPPLCAGCGKRAQGWVDAG